MEKILNTDFDESVEVLMSLGFNKLESLDAVEKAISKHSPKNTNDIVKFALGSLSRI